MTTTISAGWYTDPSGRFEHRYWDGDGWTDHVATSGAAVVDPQTPATAAAQPVTVTESPAPRVVVSATTTATYDEAAGVVRRQRFGGIMAGLGAVVTLTAFAPYAEAGGGAASLSGVAWGPGKLLLLAGVLLGLYGVQGLAGRRVRFHGGATAVISVAAIVGLAAHTMVEQVNTATFGIAQVEPGWGLVLGLVALLASIWPLVVLWRDDRRRRAATATR